MPHDIIKEMIVDVRGTAVRVVRKPIKHLHLGVYPPDGRVRVAAPPHVAQRGSTDLHERLSRRQHLDGFWKHAAEYLPQPLIRRVAACNPDDLRRWANPLDHLHEVSIFRNHHGAGRPCGLEYLPVRGFAQTQISNRDRLDLEP